MSDDLLFYIVSAGLSLMVLLGIHWLSKVETAVRGNRLSALAMLLAIIVVLIKDELLGGYYIWAGLLIGAFVSVLILRRIKMISMPQLVGLLNGLGGFASAVAAILTIQHEVSPGRFVLLTALVGLSVGAFTFSGSMIASGKLQRVLPQKPIVLPFQQLFLGLSALAMFVLIVVLMFVTVPTMPCTWVLLLFSLVFGVLFALPVGGADMPITISLLNSTSGVAAAITGMAIGNVLLVSVGGIVGASGLLLTLIMCRSMNRKLSGIIFSRRVAPPRDASSTSGKKTVAESSGNEKEGDAEQPAAQKDEAATQASPVAAGEAELADWMKDAKEIIIIPGYGMAVSQAQELLKAFSDQLEQGGRSVRFAIHPVAGRMPGHMNVLLAEVDIPYDKLFEMDDINPDMEKTDIVFVVGANDVINPAANTAEGTPIYGMPVLKAQEAKKLVICNFDTKPGYAGVENPLYAADPNVLLMLGDAKESLQKMIGLFG